MKKLLLIFFTLIFMTLNCVKAEENTVILPSEVGIVEDIQYLDYGNDDNIQTKESVKIKLLSGDFKGENIIVENMLTGNPYYDVRLAKGTKVILHVEQNADEYVYSIEDIKRSDILVGLSLLFCALLIFIGKKKGLCSLISIVLTCVFIYYGLAPMILNGVSPIFATVLICLISTALTMYFVGGFNRKSTSAVIGCFVSLIFAGILAFITVKVAHLTGFANENSVFLYSAHPELDFISVTVSMIMLATLGAVMDVGMSISSTINEIYTVDNTKKTWELFVCGMNVGKDIIGTMANTLILVYIGGALPLLLLASNIDFCKFINLNQVVTEIASALIGSSAIVLCIPITAIIASELIKNIPEKFDFSNLKN